ncbi:hypothetical protein [Sphingomonas adhaesiva]|uniref:hypothetical protein n=1 Tax=Sphingomonas adhaesiva TaxID=28212 RepID=UPI002FF8EE4A
MTETTMYATRDFRDAGTERAFTRGEAITDVPPGAMANYTAAGLVSRERPKDEAEADESEGDAGSASTTAGGRGARKSA